MPACPDRSSLSRRDAGARLAGICGVGPGSLSTWRSSAPRARRTRQSALTRTWTKGCWRSGYKGHKILVYAFATNQFKPYVRELYTLRGENVTRDAPPDHLHHHGLMYAVYVNGINFWEERGAPGD